MVNVFSLHIVVLQLLLKMNLYLHNHLKKHKNNKIIYTYFPNSGSPPISNTLIKS